MRNLLLIFAVFVLAASQAMAQRVSITGPRNAELVEGREYTVAWDGSGIRSVHIIASGMRTPVGGKSRGNFSIVVAKGVRREDGSVRWKAPWIDAASFAIKAKAYDSKGRLVAQSKRTYYFRPAVMANRKADGLYLALQKDRNQRLYKQVKGRITRVYISSSSEKYDWRRRNSHPRTAHDHDGVYRIVQKERSHYSTIFKVDMPYAMRYHGGHYIHATSPSHYADLGQPASGGCNRLTRRDARELYLMTPIGTRVEVIGPKG